MGKRKTATTKGGRYMNPADQVRKAARKRELKKVKHSFSDLFVNANMLFPNLPCFLEQKNTSVGSTSSAEE